MVNKLEENVCRCNAGMHQVAAKVYLFFITPSVIADIITIWCVSLNGCIIPIPIITINSLNSGANRKLVLMIKVGMKVLKKNKIT